MDCPDVSIRHILFATDHSQTAQCAFAYAARVAKQFDARMTVLHVLPDLPDLSIMAGGIERSVTAKNWHTINREYLQEVKARLTRKTKEDYGGEEVAVIIETGNPADTILLVAEKSGCDFIVMGAR